MSEFNPPAGPQSSRTTVRRHRERGNYDRSTVDAILDEGLICHVGFSDEESTYVLPTSYVRIEDALYLHGAAANHMLGVLAKGRPACVTVTLLDGLVLARSSFNHSMNYRSATIFSTGSEVEDPHEKRLAMDALVEHIVPGRTADARPPTEHELRATRVVRLPIEEFSAKVRVGPPIDDDDDRELPIWAGVIPLRLRSDAAIDDPALIAGIATPAYATRYPERGGRD